MTEEEGTKKVLHPPPSPPPPPLFIEELCTAGEAGSEAARVTAKEKEIAEYVKREGVSRLCYELRRVLLSACRASDWARVRTIAAVYIKLINKKVIDGLKFVTVLDDILDSKPYPVCKDAFCVAEALAVEFKDLMVSESSINYKIFTGPFNRFTKRIVGIDPALCGRVKAFMVFVSPKFDAKREDHLATPIVEVPLTAEQKAALEVASKSQFDAFWATVGITKTPGSLLAAIKGDPNVLSNIESSVYAPIRKRCVAKSAVQKPSFESFSSVNYLKSPVLFSLQLEDPAFARIVVTQIVMSAHYLHKDAHPELSQQVKDALGTVVDGGLDLLLKSATDGKTYASMLRRVIEEDVAATKRIQQAKPKMPVPSATVAVMPHQMAAKINGKGGSGDSGSEEEIAFREFCDGMTALHSGFESGKSPEIDIKGFLKPYKEYYDKKGADAANNEELSDNPMGNQLYKWRALRVTSEKNIAALTGFVEKDTGALDIIYHPKKSASQKKNRAREEEDKSKEGGEKAKEEKERKREEPPKRIPAETAQQQKELEEPAKKNPKLE